MNKKIKQRTCVGCRQKNEKTQLKRIVFVDNKLNIDEKQNMEGRGAYICPNPKCLEKATRKNNLNYRLRRKISPKTIDDLIVQFEEHLSKTGAQ